jgi:23S rRNA pseudouridine2605 synthase
VQKKSTSRSPKRESNPRSDSSYPKKERAFKPREEGTSREESSPRKKTYTKRAAPARKMFTSDEQVEAPKKWSEKSERTSFDKKPARRTFAKEPRPEENAFTEFAKKRYAPKGAAAHKPTFKEKSARSAAAAPRTNKKEVYTVDEAQSEDFRLNKYLSHAGVASRRAADVLIKEGKVKVNGEVVTEMGYKINPKDKVEFEGKVLNLEKKYYILINKPKDFITTVKDEKDRRTVMELIRSAYPQMKSITRPRLYPVGRLDRNTTGVLLITNDGEMAQKLTHPSSEIKKVYHVILDKKLRKDDFDKIAEGGVVLEDGIAEVDMIAYPNEKNRAEVGVEIHTGKNRFVRRLFESLGYEVTKLDRVYFAGLTKKDIPRGKWRFLDEEEVRLLRHFT